MALTGTADVAIAILAFWVPAFFVSILVCFRQGFKRQSGWFLILLLAVCRIISGATTVAYKTVSNPSQSLVACALITGALGISFVLSALAGVLMRTFDGMQRDKLLNPRVVRLIYLAITVAIVLSILAGTKLGGDSSDLSTARSLQEASSIIYLVVFLVLCGLEVLAFINMKHILQGDRRLVYAVALALPFAFVRLLYSLIATFGHSQYISIYSPYVWTEAFMLALMEMVVGTILLIAGLLTQPRQEKAAPASIAIE